MAATYTFSMGAYEGLGDGWRIDFTRDYYTVGFQVLFQKTVTSTTNFNPLLETKLTTYEDRGQTLTGEFFVTRTGTATPVDAGFYSSKYTEEIDPFLSTIARVSPTDPAWDSFSVVFDTPRTVLSVAGKLLGQIIDAGDAIVMSQSNDQVWGTEVGTNFQLRGGDDFIMARGGVNTIDGGAGFDVAAYSAARNAYTIIAHLGSITVAGNGSQDTMTGVEQLQFADGIMLYALPEGNKAQAYRLYQAAFERTPDQEGLAYWTSRLDDGDTSLAAIADSFLNSPEFVSTYGTEQTVGNSRFVDLLYTHTLGRDYDQEGYDYWVGKLDAGETSRRDLLAFFSESDENKAKVVDVIDDGIWLPY